MSTPVTMNDALALAAYEAWSEETYAAGFMAPTGELVRAFREWLGRRQGTEDYEAEMLALWRIAASGVQT